MGLDMYLYLEKYVSSETYDRERREYDPNPKFRSLIKELEAEDLIDSENHCGLTISIPVAYWRKFNALHGYIIEHYADGVDECQRIFLGVEDIKAITYAVTCAITDNDPRIMPPTAGFFFGNNEVDLYYWEQMHRTKERLQKALRNCSGDETFLYQASW